MSEIVLGTEEIVYYQSKVELESLSASVHGINMEQDILRIARVSSPENKDSTNTNLIKYLIENGHWSPFEMATMVVMIKTTLPIASQCMRHRSFSFQQFSQRYSDISKLDGSVCLIEPRKEHPKNRQGSLTFSIEELNDPSGAAQLFLRDQKEVWEFTKRKYDHNVARGIAKECARVLLATCLTETVFYMTGTIRSWIHYIQVRKGHGTQEEHAQLARELYKVFKNSCPIICKTLEKMEHTKAAQIEWLKTNQMLV
jgi:thymidylate synthase (FAD)